MRKCYKMIENKKSKKCQKKYKSISQFHKRINTLSLVQMISIVQRKLRSKSVVQLVYRRHKNTGLSEK